MLRVGISSNWDEVYTKTKREGTVERVRVGGKGREDERPPPFLPPPLLCGGRESDASTFLRPSHIFARSRSKFKNLSGRHSLLNAIMKTEEDFGEGIPCLVLVLRCLKAKTVAQPSLLSTLNCLC